MSQQNVDNPSLFVLIFRWEGHTPSKTGGLHDPPACDESRVSIFRLFAGSVDLGSPSARSTALLGPPRGCFLHDAPCASDQTQVVFHPAEEANRCRSSHSVLKRLQGGVGGHLFQDRNVGLVRCPHPDQCSLAVSMVHAGGSIWVYAWGRSPWESHCEVCQMGRKT